MLQKRRGKASKLLFTVSCLVDARERILQTEADEPRDVRAADGALVSLLSELIYAISTKACVEAWHQHHFLLKPSAQKRQAQKVAQGLRRTERVTGARPLCTSTRSVKFAW